MRRNRACFGSPLCLDMVFCEHLYLMKQNLFSNAGLIGLIEAFDEEKIFIFTQLYWAWAQSSPDLLVAEPGVVLWTDAWNLTGLHGCLDSSREPEARYLGCT